MSPYSTYSDEQLIAFLRSGDSKAFAELYLRFHKDTYAYLLTIVKDSELAEDLVHEVFIKIWEKREHIYIQVSFASYIFRVSHNKAIDSLKKIASDLALRNSVLTHLQSGVSSGVSDTATLKVYDDLLEEALNMLPPQRRRVFELCRQEGNTYDETAAELGLSRSTVKDHMVKALRTLREFLARKGEVAILIAILMTILAGL